MRLPAFPVPFPEETVRSVLSQYVNRTAGPVARSLAVFGLPRHPTDGVCPRFPAKLAAAMPLGHPWQDNPEEIVLGHTLVPLYLAFARPGHAQPLLERLLVGDTSNPAAALGVTQSKTASVSLARYCPDCVHESQRDRGVAVIYRSHQIGFVGLCLTHRSVLRAECLNCAQRSKTSRIWRQLRMCTCSNDSNRKLLPSDINDIELEGWIWLAKSVSELAKTNAPPRTDRHERLLAAVSRTSMRDVRSQGLQSHIEGVLNKRFGPSFLIRLKQTEPSLQSNAWVLKCLAEPGEGRGILSGVLKHLLITAALVDDVADLDSILPPDVQPSQERKPLGYGVRQPTKSKGLSDAAIREAFGKGAGRLYSAAAILGLHSHELAGTMIARGMALPMSQEARNRIGESAILSYKQLCAEGVAKTEILRQLGMTDWSRTLIELDDPSLPGLHREAYIRQQRDKHRRAVDEYLDLNQGAGRNDLTLALPSAVDWLRSFDKDWLRSAVQRKKPTNPGRPTADWAARDSAWAAAIEQHAQAELSSVDRPRWLSQTRLMAAVGARVSKYALNAGLVSKTLHAAKAHSEPFETYHVRRIAWALRKVRDSGSTVATNSLRQVAGLPPARVLEHKDFIVKESARLGLAINLRSSLLD